MVLHIPLMIMWSWVLAQGVHARGYVIDLVNWHPLKLNCSTSNSKMDCDLHSSTLILSLQINFWTSSPPCWQTPGPTSHNPASLFALQTRSTSPQLTRASQDSTCPCIHQSNSSELNLCRQSPPRCLGLCRSLSRGLSWMTAMYLHVCCWLRCHLFDH